jgi:hypothetical protein
MTSTISAILQVGKTVLAWDYVDRIVKIQVHFPPGYVIVYELIYFSLLLNRSPWRKASRIIMADYRKQVDNHRWETKRKADRYPSQ